MTCEVKLARGVKGYVFVLHEVTGPGVPKITNSKVTLSDAKATTVVTAGRRNFAQLFAVPEEVANEFKTDKELFDAVLNQKVKQAHIIQFGGVAKVSDAVKADSLRWTYSITGIDDKGIKTDVTGEGAGDDTPAKGEGPKKRLALLDQPGYLIGGLSAAVAVALGGLWLVRRKK